MIFFKAFIHVSLQGGLVASTTDGHLSTGMIK